MTRLLIVTLLTVALAAVFAPADVPFDLRLYAGALSIGGCVSLFVREVDRRSFGGRTGAGR